MIPARLLPALVAAALAVAVPGLAGCGSETASDAAAGASSVAAGSSAAADGAASSSPGAGSSTAGGSDGASVDAAGLCVFLTEELPKLEAVGSKVGAQAQFAIAFFGWGESKGLTGATQQQFDDAAKRECPAVRDQIAAVTGQTSLLS